MASLKTGTTIAGNIAWHAGNDGAGSGLDADMVDGKHAIALRPTVSPTAPTPTRVGEVWIDSDDLLLAESDWVYPTFINGWAIYDTGGYWAPARYARLFGNIVVMEGMIRGPNNTVAFVMEAGYRPGYTQHRTTISNPNVTGTIHTFADGSVVPYTPTGDTAGWISIHCMFYIDQ